MQFEYTMKTFGEENDSKPMQICGKIEADCMSSAIKILIEQGIIKENGYETLVLKPISEG